MRPAGPRPMGPGTDGTDAWHAMSGGEALHRLGARLEGLRLEEVGERRARLGPNAIAEAAPVRPFAILVRQFQSLLVGLLIAAAVAAIARFMFPPDTG